jgi:hypothetical protein
MDVSFPFAGDGSGAMGGVCTTTSPGIPLGGGGITIDGAGAGLGAGTGEGAGAGAGAAQAINVVASIIKSATVSNLFIKTSCALGSLYKTQIKVKSYYLRKTSQLATAYFNGQPVGGIADATRADFQLLGNLKSNRARQLAIYQR